MKKEIKYKPIGEYEIQPLEFVAVAGEAWISKVIELGMKILFPNRLPLSHIQLGILPKNGISRVAEAVQEGQVITSWKETDEYNCKVRYRVYRFRKSVLDQITEDDKKLVTDAMEEQCFIADRYWFAMIINWAIWILMVLFRLRPIWLIKSAEKINNRMNCSYKAIWGVNLIPIVSRLVYKKPQYWNTNDVAMWGALELVYQNYYD